MTLTEFLLARIAEDEEVAQTLEGAAWLVDGEHAFQLTSGHKYPSYRHPSGASIVPDESYTGQPGLPDGKRWARMVTCAHEHRIRGRDRNHCPLTHVTRHDPARVLAECEAKRLLVEWLAMEPREDQALAFLALPYADHPDYDEAWRP